MAFEVPADLEKEIDERMTHYPESKRSAVLPLLHALQAHFGFISEEAMEWTAAKLEMEPIKVLEVVTFYPGIHQKQVGRHHIRVCRTLSCAMAGSEELLESFCEKAKIDRSNVSYHDPVAVSEDGKYSIEVAECLAGCGTAPVCMINDDFHEKVAAEKVDELLKNYD